jgi:hypothetical protein
MNYHINQSTYLVNNNRMESIMYKDVYAKEIGDSWWQKSSLRMYIGKKRKVIISYE